MVGNKVPLSFGLEMPHFIQIKQGIAALILPSDMSMCLDDILITEQGGPLMVTEITERRKARGDWSKNPFDVYPDWAMIRYL